MPTKSPVRIVALVAMVGIAGLDSRSGTQPLGRGSSSRVIGTDSRYDTSIYIPVHLLHENEHRLVDELVSLWRGGAIEIYIFGEAITNVSQLTDLAEPHGLKTKGEVFILPHTLWQGVTGTWTEFFDDTNNRWRVQRTAAAADNVLAIVVPAHHLKGLDGSDRKPRGIRLYYSVDVADLDDLTVEAYTHAPPANGSQIAAGTAIHTNGTYDADHDTALERGDSTAAPEYHTLEFTFAEADVDWLENGEALTILVNVDAAGAAAAVFNYWGMSYLYWERPGPGMDDS